MAWSQRRGVPTGRLTARGWVPGVRDLRDVAAEYRRTVSPDLAGAPTGPGRAWLAAARLEADAALGR